MIKLVENINVIIFLIFLIVIIIFVYYILEDRKKDYTKEKIFYRIDENYVWVPRYWYLPNYEKAIKRMFGPGEIVECRDKNGDKIIESGYIKIKQYIGVDKVKNNEYHRYKYEEYNLNDVQGRKEAIKIIDETLKVANIKIEDEQKKAVKELKELTLKENLTVKEKNRGSELADIILYALSQFPDARIKSITGVIILIKKIKNYFKK
jgi:hypothetical protein